MHDRVEQLQRAERCEPGPPTLGLCEPIGDCPEGQWIVAEAAMAAPDFDVLRRGPFLFEAGAPSHHPVGTAVDRRQRHRGSFADASASLRIVDDPAAADRFEQARHVGRAAAAEAKLIAMPDGCAILTDTAISAASYVPIVPLSR